MLEFFYQDVVNVIADYLLEKQDINIVIQSRSPYLQRRKWIGHTQIFLDWPEKAQPVTLMVVTAPENLAPIRCCRISLWNYPSFHNYGIAYARLSLISSELKQQIYAEITKVVQSESFFHYIEAQEPLYYTRKEKQKQLFLWEQKYKYKGRVLLF